MQTALQPTKQFSLKTWNDLGTVIVDIKVGFTSNNLSEIDGFSVHNYACVGLCMWSKDPNNP